MLEKTSSIKLDYKPIEFFKPFKGNARTHSSHQISQIKNSISAFGFSNPILADASGVIIAGHGRLLAARELKIANIPVVILDHLTEAQARALRIADNKIALNSGWDADLLRIEMSEIGLLDS
jgi:ParB-like chromosome segregation protein Spo0J